MTLPQEVLSLRKEVIALASKELSLILRVFWAMSDAYHESPKLDPKDFNQEREDLSEFVFNMTIDADPGEGEPWLLFWVFKHQLMLEDFTRQRVFAEALPKEAKNGQAPPFDWYEWIPSELARRGAIGVDYGLLDSQIAEASPIKVPTCRKYLETLVFRGVLTFEVRHSRGFDRKYYFLPALRVESAS